MQGKVKRLCKFIFSVLLCVTSVTIICQVTFFSSSRQRSSNLSQEEIMTHAFSKLMENNERPQNLEILGEIRTTYRDEKGGPSKTRDNHNSTHTTSLDTSKPSIPNINISNNKDESKFSQDFVPDIYKAVKISGTVHFCVIAAKAETTEEVEVLVKSIILHSRRLDVTFHFVACNGSEVTIPKIFKNINQTFVNVSHEVINIDLKTYLNEKLHNRVQITHPWSGIYGLGKIFMYDLLPNVERCIIVDTDVLFATDPAFLWFELQSKLQLPVAVSVTMPKGDTYFNSGVMLQDLALMRKIHFGNLITMKGCEKVKTATTEIYKCFHDQMLLNTIMSDHPYLFDTFTVSWNLGRCFNFRDFSFEFFDDKARSLFFGAAHISCIPLKYSNAFRGIKDFLQPKYLIKYIKYLEDFDFDSELFERT